MTKDEIEYKAYLFFREKGLEYVDNIDELIEYCRDFAFPFVSYFEEKIAELKETLAQTIENDEVNYETLKLHDQEEIGMLKSRVAELEQELQDLKDRHAEEVELHLHAEDYIKSLEQQIEKMKCCGNCKHQCSFLFQDEIDCVNNGLSKWEIREND